jgi:hypothetical protein
LAKPVGDDRDRPLQKRIFGGPALQQIHIVSTGICYNLKKRFKHMKKMFAVLGLFVALIGFVAGCETVGKKLNTSDFSEGITTKKEVIAAFGDTDQEITLADGQTICTWVAVRMTQTFFQGITDRETTSVQMTFSPKGILTQITKNKTGHVAE